MIPTLSYADYLQRVTQASSEEAAGRLVRFFPTPADEERIEGLLEGFGESERGYPGLVHVYDLGQAKAFFESMPFAVQNWHYDRTAQALLVNLRRGVHEALSAVLLQAYRPALVSHNPGTDAELFLSEGLGWFRSTSSLGRVLKGQKVRLTAQEQQAFGSQRFF